MEKNILRESYIGKKIKIIFMDGEPQYSNREGIVENVDDIGQLHGTWGGLAINPDLDSIILV